MTAIEWFRVVTMVAGVFSGLSGIAFFAAGVAPRPSAPWWAQYGAAAIALSASYYLLSFALGW